ncbi:MAG: hypothetical protein E7553_01800 [Ruminococcaceae bacterium]|nr:hypothetical protein [Oscillospiraceae bacterium]
MSLQISLSDERLIPLGRISRRDNALAFDWTDSGLLFRFSGNRITLHFDAPALSQQLYIVACLDGITGRLLVCEASTDITLCADTDGEHRFYFVRCNEILDAVPMVLTGITIEGDHPSLKTAPSLPDRRLLFIGDSITCGFGNLANDPQPRFVTVEQDGTQTYAALAAKHFGAQAHFVCISGRGIARNCDNADLPLIPDFFDQTSISDPSPWDHTQYQPDVIVINAGTNDTAGEADPVDVDIFKAKLCEFATHLLTVYPNSKLLWCYGMMATDLYDPIKEALESLQSDRVEFLFFKTIYAMDNEIGACSHPNLRAHYRCAGVLINAICRYVGWDV